MFNFNGGKTMKRINTHFIMEMTLLTLLSIHIFIRSSGAYSYIKHYKPSPATKELNEIFEDIIEEQPTKTDGFPEVYDDIRPTPTEDVAKRFKARRGHVVSSNVIMVWETGHIIFTDEEFKRMKHLAKSLPQEEFKLITDAAKVLPRENFATLIKKDRHSINMTIASLNL